MKIPKVLYEILKTRVTGRQPQEILFPNACGGEHHKYWVRENTMRICSGLDLPLITAHGLRGTHASLARAAGVTGHVVSQQLGHASPEVTRRHYIRGGADEGSRRVLRVLEGGAG